MNLKNLRIMKGEMSDRKSIHEFDCHVYPRKIWVSVAAPLKELNEFFENAYEDMEESADATVSVNRRMNPEAMGGVLIRFKNKSAMTVETITHEAIHAALEVFDYVGSIVGTKNQEPFAYLCGYIARCINQVKKNKF